MDNSNGRPTHEEIARRAKAIYDANGKVPDRDVDNWLAAEAELMRARKPMDEARPVAAMRSQYKEVAKDSARH